MKNVLHDWIGFCAAAMVAAGLTYFLSPHLESFLGPERANLLLLVVVGLFGLFGLAHFVRFLGAINRRKD